MSVEFKYDTLGNNAGVLSLLKERKSSRSSTFTVLDVGASDKPWTEEVLTASIDLQESRTNALHFRGSINDARTWDQVLDYVAKNGKFSYSVCTHTLEDIAYPSLTLDMLPRVSEAGYIATPSIFREFTRNIEGPWRGYIHHRWMYVAKDGLILVPKVPYVEFMPDIPCSDDITEIHIYWEKELPYKVLNDDYLGPNVNCVREMYDKILC